VRVLAGTKRRNLPSFPLFFYFSFCCCQLFTTSQIYFFLPCPGQAMFFFSFSVTSVKTFFSAFLLCFHFWQESATFSKKTRIYFFIYTLIFVRCMFDTSRACSQSEKNNNNFSVVAMCSTQPVHPLSLPEKFKFTHKEILLSVFFSSDLSTFLPRDQVLN
jgi:hypothetical protein